MKKLIFLIPILIFIPFSFAASLDEETFQEKLVLDIGKYIGMGESASMEASLKLRQSIIDQIEKEGSSATPLLLKKINEPNMSEKALAIYIWALGFTKDPNVTNELIGIHKNNPSKIAKWNALRSLAKIGDDKAGEYLLSIAKSTQDKPKDEDQPEKFDILDMLAEMQYEKALPEMEGILKKDYKQYYWQSFFCFGKMGGKAVPYLLSKISDPNRNIRFNSISLLGQILIATEAAEPLAKRYWLEKDPEVQNLILSSMEMIVPDLGEMESFFNEVVEKEKNQKLKKFTEETIENMDSYRQRFMDFKEKKRDDRQLFKAGYAVLYKTAGTKGSIEKLGLYSDDEDENILKGLRIRILDRNSDECLYDYREINTIIMLNRLISKNRVPTYVKKQCIKGSYPIPGHGILKLTVPGSWHDDIRYPPDNLPPTIVLEPKSGSPFKVLITAVWAQANEKDHNSSQKVKELIEQQGKSLLLQAVETELHLNELKSSPFLGYYYILTDKSPKLGEFKFMTQGGIGVGGLLLTFTILTHTKDSKAIDNALKMLANAIQQFD